MGTHPNASISSTFSQMLGTRPPPMNSKGPKIPGMVSPTSNLVEITTSILVQSNIGISINPCADLQQLHALDIYLSHQTYYHSSKNHQNQNTDAPNMGLNVNREIIKKFQFLTSANLTSRYSPDCINQDIFSLQTRKFHNFLTSNDFGQKTGLLVTGRRTFSRPPTTFDQNIHLVNPSSFSPLVFPHET